MFFSQFNEKKSFKDTKNNLASSIQTGLSRGQVIDLTVPKIGSDQADQTLVTVGPTTQVSVTVGQTEQTLVQIIGSTKQTQAQISDRIMSQNTGRNENNFAHIISQIKENLDHTLGQTLG